MEEIGLPGAVSRLKEQVAAGHEAARGRPLRHRPLLFPDGPAQNGLTYPRLAVLREPCVTFSQPNEVELSVRAQFTLP